MGAWMKAEWKLMPCVLCTHQTQIMAGGGWHAGMSSGALMTGKAGLRELCSSSGAAFHHQFVSPGKRCDFLCASVMISCTWLSLHSPVLPGTLSAAFLNQVHLTQFLFKQYNIGWYVGTPPWGLLHLPHALWIFWLTHPSPKGSWTCCSITTCWLAHGYESPSCLSHIDLLLPTAYKSSSGLLSVSVCFYTPCSTIYPHDTPQEASRSLPHLHSSE